VHDGTRYVELVFLHAVGSVGHVVHSIASGTRNINTLFSCSGATESDLTQIAPGHVKSNLCFASGGICGSRSAFWCVRGAKHQHIIFHAQVGPIQIRQKAL
jgi:hypothetical protein